MGVERTQYLFILKHIADFFDHPKYIHVIRNGLDMSFSKNQAQLFNWGGLFGIRLDSSISLPKTSLQFWIKAKKEAIRND
jgi:hypothetical protein